MIGQEAPCLDIFCGVNGDNTRSSSLNMSAALWELPDCRRCTSLASSISSRERCTSREYNAEFKLVPETPWKRD
jgi:hypothetical protein